MQLEEEKAFIRSVTVDRNSPIIVLFSGEQIKDIAKFCCNDEGPNSLLCVDTTFNFYVVINTYKHLQLITRRDSIVSSDSGGQPHIVSALKNHKYKCNASCMQFKSRKVCSHTLPAAADNKDLQESDITPNVSQLQYQNQLQGGLKMVFTRVSAQRPPKPASDPDNDNPFQMIEIHGNIRKCTGCGPLSDGPARHSMDDLDSKYCLHHKELDHFYSEKYAKWIPKLENKHLHIAKECVLIKHSCLMHPPLRCL